MKDQKFDSIYSNEDGDTIARELAGIIVFSFIVAVAVVVAIFLLA